MIKLNLTDEQKAAIEPLIQKGENLDAEFAVVAQVFRDGMFVRLICDKKAVELQKSLGGNPEKLVDSISDFN